MAYNHFCKNYLMSIHKPEISTAVTKEIVTNASQAEDVKSKTKKILFAVAGFAALILAILGIVVPGLPCTPFALLSAAMFAKSSEKLYNKLLRNRILGSRIRNYKRRKGVTKKGKIQVIILMWTMVLISSFLIIKITLIRTIILSAGVIGAMVVWFLVPEGKEPEGEDLK